MDQNIIVTPVMSHATGEDWCKVYEPAEDTFLLLDAIQKDWDFLNSKKPLVCLEVGSGAGMVISALAQELGQKAFCLSTDINPSACLLTQRTARKNCVMLDSVQVDLVHSLRSGIVDLVVFNPPYVVTSSEEVKKGDELSKSWAGGLKGREVIDRFINSIVPFLSSTGFGYLLLLRENQPEEVIAILNKAGCQCTKILSRQLRGEFLTVIRFESIS